MGKPYSCGYTDDGIGHNCCVIVDKLKELDFDGHIEFLEHYLKALPVMYDKGKLETILYDWKELQKLMGNKNNES